jgi:hypothetical protein
MRGAEFIGERGLSPIRVVVPVGVLMTGAISC